MMNADKFILTNEQRKYLGLTLIEPHWERMDIKSEIFFFDGDTIRKHISVGLWAKDQLRYREADVNVETAEGRTIVLPKTAKGKPKKLNYTATTTFNGVGMYFRVDAGNILMGNYTTQKTFYTTQLDNGTQADIERWLAAWKDSVTDEELQEIEIFRNEKRVRQKYKEGDIFRFKYGRRQYGFGKIIIDIVKRRKTKAFQEEKHCGLNHLMGTALIVKLYRVLSDKKDIDINTLEKAGSLPAQTMMDNTIYYGEHEIIGHSEVTLSDMEDSFLSVSRSISASDPNYAYLQYGLIYKRIPKELYLQNGGAAWDKYRSETIGYFLYTDDLEACIKENSNRPYFEGATRDLRNPENQADKESIFQLFGLDGKKGYAENWAIYSKEVIP